MKEIMKKIMNKIKQYRYYILILLLGVILQDYCIDYADVLRGYDGIGGEYLIVPSIVLLEAWFLF